MADGKIMENKKTRKYTSSKATLEAYEPCGVFYSSLQTI